ncbi:MAG: hypothetical protein HYX40_02995 [Sphingobacteriales bacterium]|nr:hypothetical protein [Sphingobacteriales bacterium]
MTFKVTNALSLLFLLLIPQLIIAQPYITTGGGAGLGEYGYLEKDAYTYATLHRNNISGIDFLSARFWVTDNNSGNGNGVEYVYHTYDGPDGNWNCDNAVYYKQTLNYSPSNFSTEWKAGSDVYVSVFGKQCPVGSGPWLPSAPNGSTTGYNEKHFQVIDIDNSPHVSVTNLVGDGNGNCSNNKVVASFVIDPGSISGLSLTRLKLWNNGSAQETNDIPNGYLKICYEPSTGSETFSGNETWPATNVIWGDWNSDYQYNNIYEAANLSVPISGKTRFYVTLCDLSSTFSQGRTVLFYIVNDGIDFSPSQSSNGSTSLRTDYTNITNAQTVLPLSNVRLSGVSYSESNNIEMIVNHFYPGTKFMILQRSDDTRNWTSISTYDAMAENITKKEYVDRQLTNNKYFYRLKYISTDGKVTYSYIIELKSRIKNTSVGYELITSTDGLPWLKNYKHYSGAVNILVTDASGKLMVSQTASVNRNTTLIKIPLSVTNPHGGGEKYSYKFVH